MSQAITTFRDEGRLSQAATAESDQQRAIAETQSAMIVAKKFPRDVIAATDAVLSACTRPTLAESAVYSYTRGGQEVTGPSIRLAEAIAQSWGNVQYGIRELDQRDGESSVEAFAWDVQTNTRRTMQFQVRHERHTKNGSRRLTDPRDIYELVANQGARRLRSCILGVIPGDIVEEAVKQCEQTLRAKADTSPESIKNMVEKFGEFGVTQDMIQKRLACRIEAIRPAQIVQLRKIYRGIKDGMSHPSDWFEMADAPSQEKGVKGLQESLEKQMQVIEATEEVAA
ncbi:MAG: hypothetical protein ACK41W_11375 [Cyanobacteriota bacterium]|jgi:hypothetical protein